LPLTTPTILPPRGYARARPAHWWPSPVDRFLVNRRMNKSQQMRWSRHGADLLLQVRCVVLNGKFGPGFGQLFDANPSSETAMAA
jgi:hypothetical protein